jgi:Flp pilus assembly protein TadB
MIFLFALLLLFADLRDWGRKRITLLRAAAARRREESEAIALLEGFQACFRAGLETRAALRLMLEKRGWSGSSGAVLSESVIACNQGESVAHALERGLRRGYGHAMSPQLDCFWRVLQLMSVRGGNSVELSGIFLERARDASALRRRVNGLMAQIRIQSLAIQLSPLGVLLILSLVSYDKVRFLFGTSSGLVILTIALLLHAVGSLGLVRIERWASIARPRRR